MPFAPAWCSGLRPHDYRGILESGPPGCGRKENVSKRVCSFEWGLEETSPVAPGLSTGGLLCFLPFLSFRPEVSVLSLDQVGLSTRIAQLNHYLQAWLIYANPLRGKKKTNHSAELNYYCSMENQYIKTDSPY